MATTTDSIHRRAAAEAAFAELAPIDRPACGPGCSHLTQAQHAHELAVRAVGRSFSARDVITAAGYVPGWPSRTTGTARRPFLGELAVVSGLGYWRQGIVVKVTETYVFVDYVTPNAPTTVRHGKGDRSGQRTELYVLPRPSGE